MSFESLKSFALKFLVIWKCLYCADSFHTIQEKLESQLFYPTKNIFEHRCDRGDEYMRWGMMKWWKRLLHRIGPSLWYISETKEKKYENKYSINLIYSTRSMFSYSLHPFISLLCWIYSLGLVWKFFILHFCELLFILVSFLAFYLSCFNFHDLCWAFSQMSPTETWTLLI